MRALLAVRLGSFWALEPTVLPVRQAAERVPNSRSWARDVPAIVNHFALDHPVLVGDPGKTIEEGAVLPWNSGGRRLSMYAAGEQGVRLNVPYRSLTERERDIVLRGDPVQRRVTLQSRRTGRSARLSVNYDNAVAAC
jgi:excinuclease UvrABC ATPase subunit